MERLLLALVVSCWSAPALADEPPPLSGSLTGDTAFVSGPTGQAFNPSLSLGIRLGTRLRLSEHGSASATWGLARTQTFGRPLATATGHPVNSTDLRGSLARTWSGDRTAWTPRVDIGLPASRNAFVCNPFYGSIGAGVTATHEVGEGALSMDLSGARSFFRHAAAPIGRCRLPASDYTGTPTLTGTVQPVSGARHGALNTAWTGAATAKISDPHAWLAPAVEKLTTTVSIGLNAQRRHLDGAATLDTLTGPVVLPPSRAPVVLSLPVSVGAGWALSDRVEWGLTFANTVPGVLDDPGAFYRNIPAKTAVRTSLTGRW